MAVSAKFGHREAFSAPRGGRNVSSQGLALVLLLCSVAVGPGVALADSAPDRLSAEGPSSRRVAVLYSPKFLMHDTGPGHPERPERRGKRTRRRGDAGRV